MGIEVAVEAEKLGNGLLERYPKALVVAGQLIFEEDTGLNRILHGETAFLIQRRLQNAGVPMIVLPVQLDLKPFAGKTPRSRRIDGSMDRYRTSTPRSESARETTIALSFGHGDEDAGAGPTSRSFQASTRSAAKR